MGKTTRLFKAILAGVIIFTCFWIGADYYLNLEDTITKDVIYLNTGKQLIADDAKVGSLFVYYSSEGTKKVIKRQAVEKVVTGEYVDTVKKRKTVTAGISSALDVDERSVGRFIDWILFLFKSSVFLGALIGVILFFKPALQQSSDARSEARENRGRTVPVHPIGSLHQSEKGPEPIILRSKTDLGLREKPRQPKNESEKVVQFFLNIYKAQLRAPSQAPSDYRLLADKSTGGMQIYELSVQPGSEEMTRRMTIGPLGEGSGSKSTCFYVIFGSHMVVKIPPKPITDFYIYVKDILKEEKIVSQLSPRTCIIPKISVILKKVHPLPNIEGLTSEQLETRYLKWIGDNATYQNYLKIGGSFVFFMDLSNYFFLESVIGELHELEEKPFEEIMRYFELIWRPEGFGHRYGNDTESICYNLQALYVKFEAVLKPVLAKYGRQSGIPEYNRRRWLFTLIGGQAIDKDENDLPMDLLNEVNSQVRALLKNHKKEVNAYRKLILEYIQRRSEEQNKPKQASIISNLLDLLVWLNNKHVALRDLKPDNLLVVGNKEKYPQFLSVAEKFTIGIIDMETAVITTAEEEATIQQPRLGGTPFYATPSHLLNNRFLESTYLNLAHTLHLQDWHATIGMIYKTVTGKTLFEKTARLFPSIFVTFQKMYANQEDAESTIQNMSHLFWQKAENEFAVAMDKSQDCFVGITPQIPLLIANILKPQVSGQLASALVAIQNCVQRQNFFKSDKKRQDLIMFSAERVDGLCRKWEAETRDSGVQDVQVVLDFFQELAKLKRNAEKISAVIEKLEQTPPSIPADILMQGMFRHVQNFMDKTEWRSTAAVGIDLDHENCASKDAKANEATMAAGEDGATVLADEDGATILSDD